MLTAISRPAKSPEDALSLFTAAYETGFQGIQAKSGQYDAVGFDASEFRNYYGETSNLIHAGFVVYPGADSSTWMDTMKPLISYAKEIEAQHICMCTPVKPWDKPEDQYAYVALKLNTIGKYALEQYVTISLHNHAGTLFESEDDIDALCSNLDPHLCGLTFDTAHAAKGNITKLSETVLKFRDHINNVHLKDMDDDGNFCPPGKGILDLVSVIDALKEISYDKWLVIDEETKDLDHAEACQIAMDFLKENVQ